MSRDIFRKVPNSEKKVLFREAIQTQVVFFLKGGGEDIILMHLFEYIENQVLVFQLTTGSPTLETNQKVVVNFSVGEQRYYFHAEAEVFGHNIHISAKTDVYILQRRKSPRLEIPAGYPSGLNFIEYRGTVGLIECELLDFSTGGARVLYRKHLPEFQQGDQLKTVVHLNIRRPIEVQAEIRHVAHDYLHGNQTIGLQFIQLNSLLENRLLVVFMDLQRELFSKWNL
ncbi:MAG: PilZ domain-containing protein [Bdellovibrionales bacterium]